MTKNTLYLHLDILDNKRQELLGKLSPFLKGFILGGGTALALQVNHRKSYDFDFFSYSPIAKNLLERISQIIAIANIAVDSPSELTFFTENNIKVTFLHYPFKDISQPVIVNNNLQLFSIADIAIKKAYTIGRRGEYRDYFDLYTIIKNNYMDLSTLITDTKKIYGSIFEEKIFLQQLVYFDDFLNLDIISVASKEIIRFKEVKHFLEKLVKDYLKE